MSSCALEGGCPSDYVAVSISILSIFLLIAKWTLPYIIHKVPRPKGSSFWLVAIQVIASFNLLLSIVMALNFLKLRRRHWWRSCYLWAVWIEGPLGFGLLLDCRIVQAFQLYYIFVKRRMPPIRSHIFLPLILLPWIVGSAVIHMKKPMNYHCHIRPRWIIPVIFLHALYVAALVWITRAVHHIDFRFREVKDLWRGILVSTLSIVWKIDYLSELRTKRRKKLVSPPLHLSSEKTQERRIRRVKRKEFDVRKMDLFYCHTPYIYLILSDGLNHDKLSIYQKHLDYLEYLDGKPVHLDS